MSEELLHEFDDSYPEDDEFSVVPWECAKCHSEFVDPDDYPNGWRFYPVEKKNHWLGITEPICTDCAAKSGIPSIDEE